MEELGEDRQRRVARALGDRHVNLGRRLAEGDAVAGVGRRCCPVDGGMQFVERGRRLLLRHHARQLRLHHQPRLVDVTHRHAVELQREREALRQVLDARAGDAGSAPPPPQDLHKPLGLEDPQRLAQRRAGDPEDLHQLVLGREPVAGNELAAGYLRTDRVGDELGRARRPLRGSRHSDVLDALRHQTLLPAAAQYSSRT